MKITINRKTAESTPRFVRCKLLTSLDVCAQFERGFRAIALDVGATGKLAAKLLYSDSSYVLSIDSWTYNNNASNPLYTFSTEVEGALESLFASADKLTFLAEIEWKELGRTYKTPTFTLEIENAVIK